MLTATRLREVLFYDPESGLFTWKVAPNGRITIGQIAGSPGNEGYISIKIDRVLYRAHRLAWLYMTGEWPQNKVDHKNRDVADNKWSNLRAATNQQNCFNQGVRRNNKAGLKGVHWHKQTKKWAAAIAIDGVQTHLGLFPSAERAHQAYAEAARTHRGEFARVN